MPLREMEYEAWTKEEEWRIAHGQPSAGTGFRTTDSNGKVVPNVAAIKKHIDNSTGYPGITVPAPKTPGKPPPPPDIIVGRDARGNTRLERPDGSQYSRPPKKGDAFQGPTTTVPNPGMVIDMNKLQCP
jgi:hypothetical protein